MIKPPDLVAEEALDAALILTPKVAVDHGAALFMNISYEKARGALASRIRSERSEWRARLIWAFGIGMLVGWAIARGL